MIKSYSDKLKDPRWQRKRLEILNRDEFKCRSCGDTEKMLHVHHLCYEKNKEPWETKNDDLVTLCADCHSAATYLDAVYDKLNIGLETVYCVVDLYHEIEWAAIEKFRIEREKKDAELGIKHNEQF